MTSRYLLHATYGGKAKAIEMVGLRVGPKTRPGTGYCRRDDYDCQREEAYRRSEEVHEQVRQKAKPRLPTRQRAIFFNPQEGYFCVDEPGQCVSGHDERGRPVYDFGFGKDTLFVVDAERIPCACGVGDSTESDDTFRHFMSKFRNGPLARDVDPVKASRKFWGKAKAFDWRRFEPLEEAFATGDRTYQDPEIWCPCAIPRTAIVGKHDSNNPLPE